MPECDPLTGALHFQYPLLNPTNVGIPALKTGSFVPSVYTDKPNPNLVNPTGGTVFVPSTQGAVQAAIAAALGKDTTAAFKTAVTNAPPAGNTPGSNAPAGNAPGGSSGGSAGGSSGGSVAPGPLDFLTNPVSIFGFSVPTWGIFAALGLGAFALAGKHR
jgi:hypothetical protein